MTDLILTPSGLEFERLFGAPPERWLHPRLAVCEGDGGYWAICGIGPAAAAMTTTALVEAYAPDRVIMAGIGGAFPPSGLRPGAIVQASGEVFADVGYRDADGFHNLDAMGLAMAPLADDALGCRYSLAPLAPEAAPAVEFLTVASVTADRETADALWSEYGAAVENMEGAGAAMACALYGAPFHEVRAISNLTGPRDRKKWRIDEPLAALREWLARHR